MNSTSTIKKRPIFVIGTARSGTSWLGTLLASHPDIAGVTAVEHKGIHESHFLSHTRYCFSKTVTCKEFLDRYQEEDYFKLLGFSPDAVCKRLTGKCAVEEIFRGLMDEFAERNSARCWVEKTPRHAIYFRDLCSMFPDARFVIIRRRFKPTILSNLNIYAKKHASRATQIAEKVFRYVSDAKAMGGLKKLSGERVVEVRYEDLVQDTDDQLRRILLFLGVEPCELRSTFPRNSSYQPGKKSKFEITVYGWLGVHVLKAAFSLIPFAMMRAIRRKRDMRQAGRFPKYRLVQADTHISEPMERLGRAKASGPGRDGEVCGDTHVLRSQRREGISRKLA